MLTPFLTCISIYLWFHTSALGAETNSHSLPSQNVFHDPQFWQHFEKEVRAKAWSCDFGDDILLSSLEKDAALYDNPTLFKKRRRGVQQWTTNTSLWIETALGACKELSNGETGKYVRQLDELKILEAFSDYMDHLNFFQMVADKMDSLGQRVKPLSQDSSGIHDIDKLDPIMLVGYSEKFEDLKNTSVWDLCVDRHTKVNPHHQAHCLWHGCCKESKESGCAFCDSIKTMALREMVCDKVSRRVQKNLFGRLSKDMWDVDMAFYSGLPEDWLERAKSMMLELKGNDTYT